MFKVIISLREIGEYEKFEDAWVKMFHEISMLMTEQNGISLMALEQTCYMTFCGSGPLGFYETRDLAYRCGLMSENALLVENPKPLTNDHYVDIFHFFHIATAPETADKLDQLKVVVNETANLLREMCSQFYEILGEEYLERIHDTIRIHDAISTKDQETTRARQPNYRP